MTLRTWFAGQLVVDTALNEDDRDTVNFLKTGGAMLPTGVIAPWSDDIAVPPTNWHGNDGGASTHDLRDRFVRGAGPGGPAIGDTGGAETITLSAHNDHSLVVPSHRAHVFFPSAHSINSSFNDFQDTGFGGFFMTSNGHGGGGITGDHPHTFAGAPIDNSIHAHAALNVLPPYRSHGFVEKTSSPSVPTPRTWTNGETPSASDLNTEWRDNVNNAKGNLVPIGMMGYWTGNLGDLPPGWALCDGSGATLDMRARFAPGQGGSYAVDAAGGAATGTISAHGTHSVLQPDTHGDHGIIQTGGHSGGGPADTGGGLGGNFSGLQFGGHTPWGVDSHAAHSGFSLAAHAAHSPISLIPPYRAYYIVQFISAPVFTNPRTWVNGDVVSYSQMNTYLRDNFTSLLARVWPIGMTLLWGGNIGAIPTGFTLDMAVINGFAVGADGVSYAVNQVDGTPAVRSWDDHPAHTVHQPSNHNNHSITQPNSHSGTTIAVNNNPAFFPFASNGNHNFQLDIGESHHTPHAFTVDGGAAHSGHGSQTVLPPWYALAYIQRTS